MHYEQEEDQIKKLRDIQLSICSKLEKWSDLNSEYQSKQQKQFAKAFLQIMDKMGNELAFVKSQYDGVDAEIEKHSDCQELAIKLNFFKNECLTLSEELEENENKLIKEEELQMELMRKEREFKTDLLRKEKKIQKYKVKALTLANTEVPFSQNKFNTEESETCTDPFNTSNKILLEPKQDNHNFSVSSFNRKQSYGERDSISLFSLGKERQEKPKGIKEKMFINTRIHHRSLEKNGRHHIMPNLLQY